MFLLDTNICIYIIRQKPANVLEKFQTLSPSDVGVSCHAFKLGMGSEQDARTTMISSFLTLRFKCQTAYHLLQWLNWSMELTKVSVKHKIGRR